MENQIKYMYKESLLKEQAAAEKAMLEAFHAGHYTLENPYIVQNPYLINPLSAMLLFQTEAPTAVTVTVLGKEPEGNISHTYPKATTHILPVLGLYPATTNRVEISLYRGETKTVLITTDPLKSCANELVKMDTTYTYLKNQLIVVAPVVSGLATGYDYNGDIRWRLDIPTVFEVLRLKNGHIMTGTHRRIKNIYFASGLYELDMCGKIYKEFSFPGGYHHDHIEMPDGNILALSDDLLGETVEDVMHLLDRETGAVLKTWDINSEFPSGVALSGTGDKEDWAHINGLFYDEKTSSLTLSCRHIDAIINIDYDSGKLNWIIGDPDNWPQDMVDKYFFTPVGDAFHWQYEQHAVLVTPNGDVMCFDNGHWRAKRKENYRLNQNNFSRGVRYKINTDNMTIEQVWEYGTERGAEFFSQYISNVSYYRDGHYLVHSGGIQYLNGKAAEPMIVFTPDNPDSYMRSITVEMVGDTKMLEMELTRNYYRAKRMDLYGDYTFSTGEPKLLGAMAKTKTYDGVVDSSPAGAPVPAQYDAQVVDEEDRFRLMANYSEGQSVFIQLSQGEQTLHYVVDTTARALSATSSGDFLLADKKNSVVNICKAGLCGKYNLQLSIDGKTYDTGIEISC